MTTVVRSEERRTISGQGCGWFVGRCLWKSQKFPCSLSFFRCRPPARHSTAGQSYSYPPLKCMCLCPAVKYWCWGSSLVIRACGEVFFSFTPFFFCFFFMFIRAPRKHFQTIINTLSEIETLPGAHWTATLMFQETLSSSNSSCDPFSWVRTRSTHCLLYG